MEYYEVEVDCMQYCYGGSAKFTVDPNGYGEWAKRADVELLIADRDRLAAENAELRKKDGSGLIAEAERLMAENAELRALVGKKNESIEILYAKWSKEIVKAEAANAMLAALREAIRRQHAELFYMTAAQHLSVGFDAKKETDNG